MEQFKRREFVSIELLPKRGVLRPGEQKSLGQKKRKFSSPSNLGNCDSPTSKDIVPLLESNGRDSKEDKGGDVDEVKEGVCKEENFIQSGDEKVEEGACEEEDFIQSEDEMNQNERIASQGVNEIESEKITTENEPPVVDLAYPSPSCSSVFFVFFYCVDVVEEN